MSRKNFQNIVTACVVFGVTWVSGFLNGCTDELGIVGNRPSDYICFTVTLGNDSLTATARGTSGYLSFVEEEWELEGISTDSQSDSRATLVTQLEGSAGVIGTTESGTLLDNEEFTFNGDELTPKGNPVFWKNVIGTNLNIYAYAPKTITGASLSGRTLTYTVPAEASTQTDIIAASTTVASSHRQTIPLTFNHVLTGIRFKLGFECTVNSITISGVHNQGSYAIGGVWTAQSGTQTYTIASTDDVLMMIPQTLPNDAKVTLNYDDNQEISTNLKGQKWESGKLITYTLHKDKPNYVYFDLAAGNVMVDNTTGYKGYVFKEGQEVAEEISGSHADENVYYVYQSTSKNKATTGLRSNGSYVIPTYDPVKASDGRLWSDFITNNPNVESVIEAWDNAAGAGLGPTGTPNQTGAAGAVREVGREATKHRIHITGTLICNLTIDNIYSSYQAESQAGRTVGAIGFVPVDNTGSKLIINIVGDNRVGCVHYFNTKGLEANDNELIFQGIGSLTVADTDYRTVEAPGDSEKDNVIGGNGYYSNHWSSAIGNNDGSDDCWGIIINSGVIFAGTTKAENCTALGAGGNGYGEVTINGGVVTAVASTTGTAIGGGIGFNSPGGEGRVVINGGNVYAYNHANRWNVPSSAIGGAGSKKSSGTKGTVIITGGNVYAQAALGTAIGGGSSYSVAGGDADIQISGGKVVAKSISALGGNGGPDEDMGKELSGGSGIGGGSACTGRVNTTATTYNGGTAKITISGSPIVRTGSIGGGNTGDPNGGKIGSADIKISGGDIQAQFVMAAGAKAVPEFTMSGGFIRNSDTSDSEYIHIVKNGGAVYLEDGSFTMTGGTITDCIAVKTDKGTGNGGAVYIKGTNNPTFEMSGGTISDCISGVHGGAVYLEGGTVELSGGEINDNLAQGGNGGGIYIKEGRFVMSGNSEICGNSALFRNNTGGYGGGLYVTSFSNEVTVDVLSGTITGNSSDRCGGGISVDMAGLSVPARVTVGTEGCGNTNPNISGNQTLLSGGGLYVKGSNANITIYGGKINGNSTSGYVANENVANEGGMVTLYAGDVTHNVVTFHGNGGTHNGSETAVQNIVTATNSSLVIPAFERLGFRVVRWNTRADGRGDDYVNGQRMNISSDIELYAIWEVGQ